MFNKNTMQSTCRILFILSAHLLLGAHSLSAQIFLDVETGAYFPGPYNNIRIPRSATTQINAFGADFEKNPGWFARGRVGYTFGRGRHTLVTLVAPLSLETTTKQPLSSVVNFQGTNFEAGLPLTVQYKFNSYRLTYRYNLVRSDKLKFGLGLSAKIRDARVGLENGVQQAEKTDLGFVPLINFYLNWKELDKLGFLLEGDALAGAGPGRAEDVFIGFTYQARPKILFRMGYRILEGGADVEETYNFTLIHFASVGATVGF